MEDFEQMLGDGVAGATRTISTNLQDALNNLFDQMDSNGDGVLDSVSDGVLLHTV